MDERIEVKSIGGKIYIGGALIVCTPGQALQLAEDLLRVAKAALARGIFINDAGGTQQVRW